MGCPEYTQSDYMRLVTDEPKTLYKRIFHTVSDDKIGNRINYQDMSYAYNKLNQLVSVKSDASSSPLPYHYDDWGNLLKTPTWTYKYDMRNRLIEAEKRDEKVCVNYSYDPLGQRVKSVCGEKNTDFLMSGMVEQARVTKDGEMFHTMGLDIVDTLHITGGAAVYLASSKAKGVVDYLYDGNGNVTSTANQNGKLEDWIVYSPFGEIEKGNELAFNFSSKAMDESGLYYYGFRFYSSSFGRWLKRDKMHELAGKNFYVFLNNDPVLTVDYIGLYPVTGSTFDEVSESLVQHAIDNDGNWGSYTFDEASVQYEINDVESYDETTSSDTSCAGGCRFDVLCMGTLHYTSYNDFIDMPELPDSVYNSWSQDEKDAWYDFYLGLATHEIGHQQITSSMLSSDTILFESGTSCDGVGYARSDCLFKLHDLASEQLDEDLDALNAAQLDYDSGNYIDPL